MASFRNRKKKEGHISWSAASKGKCQLRLEEVGSSEEHWRTNNGFNWRQVRR